MHPRINQIIKKAFLFCITPVSILYSCAPPEKVPVSDEMAKKEIIRFEGLPKPSVERINKKYLTKTTILIPLDINNTSIKEEWYENERNLIEFLTDKKLITTKIEEVNRNDTILSYSVIDLTNEGRKYLINTTEEEYVVKLCDIDFDKIMWKHYYPDPPMTSVNYSIKIYNTTPFGEYTGFLKSIVYFQEFLFDKGWKIDTTEFRKIY